MTTPTNAAPPLGDASLLCHDLTKLRAQCSQAAAVAIEQDDAITLAECVALDDGLHRAQAILENAVVVVMTKRKQQREKAK